MNRATRTVLASASVLIIAACSGAPESGADTWDPGIVNGHDARGTVRPDPGPDPDPDTGSQSPGPGPSSDPGAPDRGAGADLGDTTPDPGTCTEEEQPPAEPNGKDDDCDGLTDEEVCSCGDGVCKPACGESLEACPCDCATCGDGACSPCGESPTTCPEDCCKAPSGSSGCGDGFCFGFGCGEDPTTCPEDCGTACGNGDCDRGESPLSCPDDCKTQVCGNGVCEPTDNGPDECPKDCAEFCGDCECGANETFLECPIDCGHCGDGVCSACPALHEDTSTCSEDCCLPGVEGCDEADDCEGAGEPCDDPPGGPCFEGVLVCDGPEATRCADGEPKGSDTICTPFACEDGVLTLPSLCDGEGRCESYGELSCGGYACLTELRCRSSCAEDEHCAEGLVCDDGSCAPEEEACANECPAPGARQCAGEGFATCGDHDQDSCLEWSEPEPCGENELCVEGGCMIVCMNECEAPGARQCSGDAVQTCDDHDSDGCVEWGPPDPCGVHEICTQGSCHPSCTSECAMAGARRCSGNGFQTCADFDEDGCLEWSTPETCGAGEVCSGGHCASTCTNECSVVGAKRCEMDAVVTCADYDEDGCLEWGTPVPCGEELVCVAGGHCASACTNECTVVGATQCNGGGVQTCGDDDDDGCLEWSAAVPCDDGDMCTAGDACSDGACRLGRRNSCDDHDPCTDALCDEATGCEHVPRIDVGCYLPCPVFGPTLAGPAGPFFCRGELRRVQAVGDKVYVAAGAGGLQILQHSGATLEGIGWLDTPSEARDVFVQGARAYVALEEHGLLVADVSTPSSPQTHGLADLPVTGRAVAAGERAFVTDALDQLWTYTVADPAQPTEMAPYPLPEPGLDLALDGDRLYVALGTSGLGVFDVSNTEAAPALVGTVQGGPVQSTVAVHAIGSDAYMADAVNQGLVVTDTTNVPGSTSSSLSPLGGVPNSVFATAEYSYLTEAEGKLHTRNNSDNARASVYLAAQLSDVWVEGFNAYVATSGAGVKVVDVRDPGKPKESLSLGLVGSAEAVATQGTRLYVADGMDGLRILDGADADNVTLLGSVVLEGEAVDLDVDGDFAYVAMALFGLDIVDATDPGSPALVGHFEIDEAEPAVRVLNGIAYVASGDLLVVDVSDPTQPRGVGHWPLSGAGAVDVKGDFAYVGTDDVKIIDVSDPTNPGESDGLPLDGFVTDLQVVGDYLFAATTSGLLCSFVLTDPASPTELQCLTVADSASCLQVHGEHAYVCATDEAGSGELAVARVVNRSAMSALSPVPMPGDGLTGVAVVGSRIWVAAGELGLLGVDPVCE